MSSLLPLGGVVHAATPNNFTGEELLGKPTDTSITINIVPATTIEYHYQNGTSPGSYTAQTSNVKKFPRPSMTGSGFSGIYTEGDHGDYQTIKILPNAGHLRVMVTPTQAKVDYVKSSGAVNYTYAIQANAGQGWSDWKSLGGWIPSTSSPAVAASSNGQLDVFVVGSDNALWPDRMRDTPGNPSCWVASSLAAVFRGSGRIDVFIFGALLTAVS